jgi:hypothetical protein
MFDGCTVVKRIPLYHNYLDTVQIQQKVARFYGEERGYSGFVPTTRPKEELLESFAHQCVATAYA